MKYHLSDSGKKSGISTRFWMKGNSSCEHLELDAIGAIGLERLAKGRGALGLVRSEGEM